MCHDRAPTPSGESPEVSVLMPVYNGERFLGEAIESILNQSFIEFSFLIIDNASTDRSVAIVESYDDPRIRLVRNETNLGLIHSLNRGLDLARGRYVARMDCDDVSLPDRFQRQVRFLNEHVEFGVVGSWVETIGDGKVTTFKYPSNPDRLRAQLLFDSPLAHPSVMMRRELINRFGIRDRDAYPQAEDWFFWKECSRRFPITNVEEVLLRHRLTPHSVTSINRDTQLETIDAIDAYNLDELGMNVNKDEAKIHRSLGFYDFEDSRSYVERAESWLLRLQAANATTAIYPEPAFSEMLAHRWFQLCTSVTSLGPWVWRRLRRSPLSQFGNIGMALRFKLVAKTLVRWRTPSCR